ncbi:MAG: histidine--tRNA ligase [Patescibacteria group bacterium]|nr:histidine--tRNA ligase [Patescibacteria group bacterium]
MPKIKKNKKLTSVKQNRIDLIKSVKGMPDILPKDESWWKWIIQTGQLVSELHDFHFIETPILEPAALFESAVGTSTDIIEKEMYAFKTKGGDRVALRPEGTAPVVRSYIEHHLGYFASPLKVFYYGPMFRYDRPQAGRERQFHQFGFEILSDNDPIYDGETILVVLDFLKSLKFKNLSIKINTIGCKVCRSNYKEKIKSYYQSVKAKLCRDCERRLEKNPLRILDCKNENCISLRSNAPIFLDYLCQNCNNHFKTVLELIEDNNVPYEPDPYLVRGLDYYNRTVFEIFSSDFKWALAGGGRYDYLSEMLGGRSIPGVGVALGIERLIEALKLQQITPHLKSKPSLFFAAVGDQAKKSSLRLINELRLNGIVVVEALGKKSLRAQMKIADRFKMPLALIFGQKEVFEKTVIMRDMGTGAQENIVLSKLVEEVKKRIK